MVTGGVSPDADNIASWIKAGQSLTVVQKGQARDNIGAASKEDLGDPVDLVAEYTAALGTTTGSTFIERKV
jgi:hypothetical protein